MTKAKTNQKNQKNNKEATTMTVQITENAMPVNNNEYTETTKDAAIIYGMDTQEIKFSPLWEESTLQGYLYVMLDTKLAQDKKSLSNEKNKLNKLEGLDSRTKEDNARITLAKAKIKELNAEIASIEKWKESAKDTKINQLAGLWAFATGANNLYGYLNTDITGIKYDIKRIQKLALEHYDALWTMCDDKYYTGQVYKDMKCELGNLFTHLYGSKLYATQAETIALIQCCINYSVKIDLNANVTETFIRRNSTTILRKAAQILCAKLALRSETELKLAIENEPEEDKKSNNK